MRVFTTSDIHIDYKVNKNWLTALSNKDYQNDILILGGDISHDMSLIEFAFDVLKKKFGEVFFVPGNHDLWVKRNRENSFERFANLKYLATQYQIQTQYKEFEKFVIVPVLSWYDFSFGKPQKRLVSTWGDFLRCSWPNMETPSQINDFFFQQNPILQIPQNKRVISFSHFLPRIDSIPAGRKITSFLAPVLGSKKLEQWIRQWPSHIHIYGHSHVNTYVHLENILYINNAFGYPSEAHITAKKLLDITYEIDRKI